jgi:hypothetical protein
MAELPPYPDTGDDTGDRSPAAGTRRWVSVVAIVIVIVLVLLLVLLHLTGTLGAGAH